MLLYDLSIVYIIAARSTDLPYEVALTKATVYGNHVNPPYRINTESIMPYAQLSYGMYRFVIASGNMTAFGYVAFNADGLNPFANM